MARKKPRPFNPFIPDDESNKRPKPPKPRTPAEKNRDEKRLKRELKRIEKRLKREREIDAERNGLTINFVARNMINLDKDIESGKISESELENELKKWENISKHYGYDDQSIKEEKNKLHEADLISAKKSKRRLENLEEQARIKKEEDRKRLEEEDKILLSEYELLRKVEKLREKVQGYSGETEKRIYVLKINPQEAFVSLEAKRNRTFPSHKYPDLVQTPRGYVYVGLTGKTIEERFEVHASKTGKASQMAKLGFLYSYDSFEECGKELTDKFGFPNVGWRDEKPLMVESWLAWNFYKMGYWVWGSHHHNGEDFLGNAPYN